MTSFSGQTVIVTGASSGLGLETTGYFARLNADHVILAVRSQHKGDEARDSILSSLPKSSCRVSVRLLDLSSYNSVLAFASRADKELKRLDCVVQNAGIAVLEYKRFEDNERTLPINVVSPMLLTLLLIPVMRRTHEATEASLTMPPRLTFVSSASHVTTKIPKLNIYTTLNNKAKADMVFRYGGSKLMQLFLSKSLAATIPAKDILINSVDPVQPKQIF